MTVSGACASAALPRDSIETSLTPAAEFLSDRRAAVREKRWFTDATYLTERISMTLEIRISCIIWCG
jgi:hypothetical protein